MWSYNPSNVSKQGVEEGGAHSDDLTRLDDRKDQDRRSCVDISVSAGLQLFSELDLRGARTPTATGFGAAPG
jgi:hypothetical protein